jgi:hypothetical protein
MKESLAKFERWFASPIFLLKALPDGDGAFAALSISFSLFERYVKSDIVRRGEKATPHAFEADAVRLTGVEQDCFEKFWGMFRVGIQHYLQPKTFETKGVKYGWNISAEHPAMPYYMINTANEKLIAFDPWKWAEWVLDLYRNDPEILDIMESHALGEVYDLGVGKGGVIAEFLMPLFQCREKVEIQMPNAE